MKIDRTFLTPHPRTVLWFEQRETCARCANHLLIGTTEMRCKVAPMLVSGGLAKAHAARGTFIYCIDAREPEGACGPDAKLFVELSLPTQSSD